MSNKYKTCQISENVIKLAQTRSKVSVASRFVIFDYKYQPDLLYKHQSSLDYQSANITTQNGQQNSNSMGRN